MLRSKNKNIVIGGGISGLCAAKTIQEMGQELLLLEQCPTLGGLTRTMEVGDFCFDYTGHFLHLSHYRTPAEIPFAGLNDDDWQQVSRRSCCFVAGKMIEAPIQYNIGQLPVGVYEEVVRSYKERPIFDESVPTTFLDFIIQGFGQYLADLFLIPQNEKTMAIPLERLSSKAVKRFFPPPVEELVRAGMIKNSSTAAEYNSTFWYPRIGGIGRLVNGLSTGLDGVHVRQPVTAIDLCAKTVQTKSGEIFPWDVLFPSMPLNTLCRISNDPDLRAAGEKLSHSSTISFNIGLNTPVKPEFEGIHWIYVPDRSIPFYRVGFYSNISKGTCTPGTSALYVEVGISSEDLLVPNIVRDLQPKVIAALEDLGWIDSRDISCLVVNIIEHAYVHFTEERDRLVEDILERLHRYCVHPIGRYGLWEYTGMEDALESSMATVREVLS
ncbi:MAG: NAD(P)-binding protein [Desulfuromonadales bacterium]|nr:NAD(P)-binding protein [Desulfuromonadales bacterium]